ncbi:MAG: aminopeptidase [Bacteroidetes bacterium]|nr:aminopeptidase [Bacteroidota bacterium]
MELLNTLCGLFGPSGNEIKIRNFIIDYITRNKAGWATTPEMIYGDAFQDCLILKFGKPRTAIFAHMDSHGFTVRYEDQLVPIGSPEADASCKLVGEDRLGMIECELIKGKDRKPRYKFGRPILTGTDLVFKCNFRETDEFIQSCYLDNRLGIYVVLKLAESLKNGVIVFSCWEEHGGGSIPYLTEYIYNQYTIHQALIADITWITDGIKPGEGVVISMRDSSIPRRSYVDRIISIAEKNSIAYQLEVEGSGSSDGREIQTSPYPVDWCFVGVAEEMVHTPDEIVSKRDIQSMIDIYEVLMREL